MTELFSKLTQFLGRVKDTLYRSHGTSLQSDKKREYIRFVDELLRCLAPLDPVGGWGGCLGVG